MSIKNIHLRKLLKILYSDGKDRISEIRKEIRGDQNKELGIESTGGDFYGPFWADARAHVARKLDLTDQTEIRISSNLRRERLYSLLLDGFLTWWNEKSRWRNRPFELILESVKGKFKPTGVDAVVKVENLLSLHIDNETHRIIYPYFCESPPLTEESARIGLWIMEQALSSYRYHIKDFRILDILRSRSFSIGHCPLHGNEEDIFYAEYRALLRQWEILKREYD